MATSKINGHIPTVLPSSEYTVTPSSGYTWAGAQIIELQPDVFYVHLNITGNFAKNSVSDVGELRIRNRTPYPNQLHCKIGVPDGSRTASGQWLTGSMVRIIYDSGDDLTDRTANIDGIVVLH